MSIIDIQARRAHRYLNNKDPNVNEVFFPITPGQITLMASLITSIVKAINKCTADKEEALKVAHNPNRFQRGMLKRITRRKVGWWRYYNPVGKDYVGAVKDAAKDLSDEDMGELLNEVKK